MEVSGETIDERAHAILAMERNWWKYQGAKEAAVRDEFGVSMPRYYQELNALIDRPAALLADPPLVHRLQRLRANRARSRGR